MTTTLEMPELLSQERVCALLGISRSTLHRWGEVYSDFPVPRKLGHSIRYDAAELTAWVLAQPRRETS